jgi:asparagine synthase (glutamine-hydrolysing)
MSVLFGRWNFDGRPVDPSYVVKAEELLAPYGPDGRKSHLGAGAAITYGAFHTTAESLLECQPYTNQGGAIVLWDGRLDNREELLRLLGLRIEADTGDVAIVAAAFEKWGTGCLPRISGDWALCLWQPRDASLILAKDAIGARPLFYALDATGVSWSSLLEPIVVRAGRSFSLNEEYLAGWLSFFPATKLTPYEGIEAVPPGSYVLVRNGRATCHEYWRFDPGNIVRYRTDQEYEEHFRTLFAESVRRRLRAAAPVTAELSGGIDSSSIVCMADQLTVRGFQVPRLDTISYYDDAEPNWNERPYFTSVEERRGRIGCQIALQSQSVVPSHSPEFRATPASGGSSSPEARQFADYFKSRNSRVLLSGIGGDEMLGGVPTPFLELADLMTLGEWKMFARQTTRWALALRKPWIQLAWQTARRFLPLSIRTLPPNQQPPFWLTESFADRQKHALQGYERRLALRGPRPSFQINMRTLEALRRQLASTAISCEPLLEIRYPYLDREILEFLCAVPREQLVRPHQRRSLMRRALAGIVPDFVLNRRRKAYASRNPLAAVIRQCGSLTAGDARWASEDLGVLNREAVVHAVQKAEAGENLPLFQLSRTLSLESWLRQFNRDRERKWSLDVHPAALPYCPSGKIPLLPPMNRSGQGRDQHRVLS